MFKQCVRKLWSELPWLHNNRFHFQLGSQNTAGHLSGSSDHKFLKVDEIIERFVRVDGKDRWPIGLKLEGMKEIQEETNRVGEWRCTRSVELRGPVTLGWCWGRRLGNKMEVEIPETDIWNRGQKPLPTWALFLKGHYLKSLVSIHEKRVLCI